MGDDTLYCFFPYINFFINFFLAIFGNRVFRDRARS
jgi:hypothetical protein